MKKIFSTTIFLISFSSFYQARNIEKEEIKSVIQKIFADSIKKQFPEMLRALLPEASLKIHTKDYINLDLNSTVLVNALNNLKYELPEIIPFIPFSVAAPIPEYNMLFYFAEQNSSFINLTNFKTEATVSNTKSKVSIAINLQMNSSSMEGHYELDISNYDMHLFGDGHYSILSNVTVISITTEINVFQDYSFLMSYFIMNITVNGTKMVMSNLLNGDTSVEPLLDFLGETIPEDISTINDMLLADINNTVVHFTNSYLASVFSWDQIVWLIQNAAQQTTSH